MSFVDFYFYPAVVLLFLVVVLLQTLMRKNERLSNTFSKALLLFFSYMVMCLYDYRFGGCITVVILVTYVGAIAIGERDNKFRGSLALVLIVFLVGMLGLFKYLNFFMATVAALAGTEWHTLNIILPIGISFYIFSAIGYVLDVFWGNMTAEKNLLDLALFLSFFPKLVCGPITAAKTFLPQLKESRRISLRELEAGIQIFVFGLFKKMVLADHLAVFVDNVFDVPVAYGTVTVWWAVLSYFLQLYFDFSGYSDMAIGISRVFGYDVGRNFNLPFTARNISEFWDRWHMSLTAWLNEYLFNPIALKLKRSVSRWPKNKRRKYKLLPACTAVMITFLVSGLWHGVGFTFIVWGLFNGVYSVLHAVWTEWMKRHRKREKNRGSNLILMVEVFINYLVLNLIQVFFRAESLEQAVFILKRMFIFQAGIEQPYTWTFFAYAILILATFAAYFRKRKHRCSLQADGVEGFYPIMDLGTVKGLTVFFVFCGITAMFAYVGPTYFIYGNF